MRRDQARRGNGGRGREGRGRGWLPIGGILYGVLVLGGCAESSTVTAAETSSEAAAESLEISFPPKAARTPGRAGPGSSPGTGAPGTGAPGTVISGGDAALGTQAAVAESTAPAGKDSEPAAVGKRKQATRTNPLTQQVETAVARALKAGVQASRGKLKPKDVVVSVVIRSVESGEVLMDRMGGTALVPASNMKILTTASALLGLGADAGFETKFESRGHVTDGQLRGDLVVRAGSDPLHVREGDGSLDRWLDPLVRDLRAAGIESIEGALILDEGSFGSPGPGPEWPAKRNHWTDYCALSGGFSANGGVFRATITTDGGKPHVTLRPKHHGLARRGSVRVTGKANALRVGANAAGVTVGGKVPKGSGPFLEEFSHPDPVDLFGASIVGGLRDRGIQIGAAERRRDAPSGTTVHVMRSSVRSVLEAILLDSNNPVADQLFFLVGHRLGESATREGAAAAVVKVLKGHGVDVEGFVQVDGSGLSKADRVTARTFVDALNVVMAHPECGPPFMAALPVSGVSGSLRHRMRKSIAKGRVLAKTGWVSGASSLSGVVQDLGGDARLTFSIVVSYPRLSGLNTAAWKPMQDEICEHLTRFVDAAAAGSAMGSGR